MKIVELEKQIAEILAAFPEEKVMEYYPRRIITPHGYLNPKYFSLINYFFVTHRQPYAHSPELLKRRDARLHFSKVLTDKNVPTYFLDTAFLEDVDQTDLLETFTFSQLHFPMPGFLFAFPHGWIKKKTGKSVPFVMVSTLNGFLNITQDELNDDGSFNNASSTVRFENVEGSISTIIKSHKNLDFSVEDTAVLDAINPDRSKACIRIFELVMKLLIIVSTRPHALIDLPDEPLAREQKLRKKGSLKAEALWHPIFIGKSYAAQRVEARDGSGPGKRMHWRRGHLRNQRYGEDRSMVKAVWIEPVLIHSELLTAANPSVKTD